jgi:hypothetical protein
MRPFRFLFAACISVGAMVACATSPTDDMDSGPADAGGEGGLSCGAATKCGVGAAAKCADLTKDPANCGACGVKCTSTQFCAGGKCSDQCNTPFKLCGQFCVNTDTDHENCGMCGKGCTSDQECVGKACVKKCTGGLTACGDVCADLTADHENCGTCSTACAMTEICSGGLCCAANQTSCMGQCVDLQGNNDNCGACGFACGGPTPYCVKGKCNNCNPAVLLIMDQDGSSDNQKLALALNGLGIPTTLINNGIETYNANPDASSFGAVLVSGGADFSPNSDMPNAGQQAIVAAHNKGVGVVLVEPLQYSVYYNSYLNTLSGLFLATGMSADDIIDDGPPYPKLTKTVNHAIWNGITAPVDLNPLYDIYVMQGGLANGATAIAQCSGAYPYGSPCTGIGTILVKTNSGGRIAHFNSSINDSAYWNFGAWSPNADIVKLMTNAVQWASNCQ